MPGRAFEPCSLPDPPGRSFVWPGHSTMAQRRTPTWTLRFATLRGTRVPPADSGKHGREGRCKVLAGRKPTLLLRFAGAFLLRCAERTFID